MDEREDKNGKIRKISISKGKIQFYENKNKKFSVMKAPVSLRLNSTIVELKVSLLLAQDRYWLSFE